MDVKPGYKQTEVGTIPKNWECDDVGRVIDLLTGFPFPSSGYSQSGTRLLRGSNVKRGYTDWSDEVTVYWPRTTPEIRKYGLKGGDVVVAMDGSLVGRSFAALTESDLPALLLQRVARIRSTVVSQRYLKAWICSPRFTSHCDAVKTTTAIPHISPLDIRSFRIAIPETKAEQEAIAEALSEADALIESLEQLIAKKRQLKRGAMHDLLTGKKRLPGFDGEWEVLSLGELEKRGDIKLYRGKVISQRDIDRNPGDYPIYSSSVHSNGLFGSYGDYMFDEELITWSVDGGGYFFFRPRHRFSVTNVCGYMRICKPTIHCGYLAYHLQMLHSRLVFDYTLKAHPSVIRSSYQVALPRPEEQIAIATILSDMDAEITLLDEKLAKARDLKQGMMQELLTGMIRLV